jgi:hypothetical protein
MSHSVVCIAPEIDFAVLVACNRDIAILKTRRTVKALIRTFAPKQTSTPPSSASSRSRLREIQRADRIAM